MKMADIKTITIYTKPPGSFRIAIRQTIIWGFLIGAEFLSHRLVGGSWVIDLMVLAGAVGLIINMVGRSWGWSAEMTPGEIRLWVAAGMPQDVKRWKDESKMRKVA